MIETTLSEFQASLRNTGAYHTAPDHRADQRAKPGAWTTLQYTWGVTQVFPRCAIAEGLHRLSTDRWAEFCFASVRTAERLGMNVRIEGFENRLAVEGPVMFLANHLSATETILLPPILLAFGPFSYVAKASLAHLPFLTKAAAHMRMVPVTRTSPRADLMTVLKIGTERIRGGDSFLVYPQGTRCEVFSRGRFSSIGAKLAERANCPIVPIVVDTRCQPTRKGGLLAKVFKDFGPVDPSIDLRVKCGPAIPVTTSREMHERSFAWMAEQLSVWGLPVDTGR